MAHQMVQQVSGVSLATHPPCNVCGLIEDEIHRGRAMFGEDGPVFCGE